MSATKARSMPLPPALEAAEPLPSSPHPATARAAAATSADSVFLFMSLIGLCLLVVFDVDM